MLITDQIAKLIEQMIDDGDGSANVQRNDLAQSVGCVPSQVSYVISSRFTPERGYRTESRRGGGGYIKIIRVPMTKDQYLTHFFYAIGDGISEREAQAYIRNLADSGAITNREARMIKSSCSDAALERVRSADGRNDLRADIMRHVLIALMG